VSPSLLCCREFLLIDAEALVAEPLTDQEIIESVAAPAANELDEHARTANFHFNTFVHGVIWLTMGD